MQQKNIRKSNLILFFIVPLLLTLSDKVTAQWNNYISFDTAFTNLYIDTLNPNNVWQIGSPHKALFDSALTRPNALITDTLSFYPANNTSSFILKINKPIDTIPPGFGSWVNSMYGPTPFVSFGSKIDMDSLSDKGYVEYSFDNGVSWLPVNTYYFAGNDYPPYYTPSNPLFTGTWNHWFSTFIYLGDGNPAPGIENVDSVLFKFSFVSDSINTNKEGWMIDNIVYGTIAVIGVGEIKNSAFNIYPNPVDDSFTLIIDELSNLNKNFKIVNSLGEPVKQLHVNQSKSQIDISDLPKGVYFLQMQSGKQMISKKIIKE